MGRRNSRQMGKVSGRSCIGARHRASLAWLAGGRPLSAGRAPSPFVCLLRLLHRSPAHPTTHLSHSLQQQSTAHTLLAPSDSVFFHPCDLFFIFGLLLTRPFPAPARLRGRLHGATGRPSETRISSTPRSPATNTSHFSESGQWHRAAPGQQQ